MRQAGVPNGGGGMACGPGGPLGEAPTLRLPLSERCLPPLGADPALLLASGEVMLAWLRCVVLRRRHNPVRHPLGGFRCVDCGAFGADLEEMGFENGGYIAPPRDGNVS